MLIDRGVDALRQHCPAFQSAGPDLLQGKARLAEPYWQRRDLGWDRMVQVEVAISEHPSVLKPVNSAGEVIAGHHCTYEIGSGTTPSIVTAKGACYGICGWKSDRLPAPELAGVFGTAPYVRDVDLDKLRAKALQGDYQAQRNLAYFLQTEVRDPEHNPMMACAWRFVILASDHPQADQSDTSNLQFACGSLTTSDQEAAKDNAAILMALLKTSPKAKKALTKKK